MSDDHNEVKEAMFDALMSDNQVNKAKELLLHWLVLFGREEVTINEIVHSGVASINIWWYMDKGLLSENTKTDIYRYALTDKAINFLNKGE
jgi:hypothetical protein